MSNLKKDMAFEEAFADLNDILKKLEGSELTLAESLELYERGMMLTQHCNTLLETAELRLKTLASAG